MTKHATWEGSNVFIVRSKGKRIVAEPFVDGRTAMINESHKYPVGIIIRNLYDAGGKVSPLEHYHVYYKGKDVESENFEHPDIDRIENFLRWRSENEEESGYHIPGFTYEKPDVDVYAFRKHKTTKAKTRQRPVKKSIKKVVRKKTKSCGCK